MNKASTIVAAGLAAASLAQGDPQPVIQAAETSKPVIVFDPSQRRFFEDRSRICCVNWHRQKGKDFTAACIAFDDAIVTGKNWYIVALTQAQADETFEKCKKVCAVFKAMLKIVGHVAEESEEFIDRDKEIEQSFSCTARILRLPNGAKIVSLPGKNPDTLAGRSGNMILTEFGLYPKGGYEHWEILFPIITRGGLRLIVISTPRGKNTKFYEVWQNEDGLYSVHTCDIVRSVFEDGYQLYDAKGNPFDQSTDEAKTLAIDTFRRIYNSPSKWDREYLCKFTGDMSSLIKWAELERAAALGADRRFDWIHIKNDSASDVAQVLLAIQSEIDAGSRCEVGWDVARHANLSVVTLNLAKNNQPKHLRFALGMNDCEFATQRLMVDRVMKLQRWSVGYGDASGMGMDSNETLEKLFRAGKGESRWTAYTFTAPNKRAMGSALQTAFNDGTQTIPALNGDYRFIALDLYAVQKDDTGANFALDEGRNELMPDSHCDVAYSLGLNRLAGATTIRTPVPPPQAQKPAGY